LFIAVDASSGGKDSKNKALSRHEFLTCLVRLAVMKYVMPGLTSDVSDALNSLFVNNINPHLDPTIFASPDDFRRNHLYQPAVAATLMKHEVSLRNLFNVMARVARPSTAKKLGLLVGLQQWKDFTRRLELIDHDLTERDTTLSFVCSRMVVIDSCTERGMVKDNTLPFEGFLEALCRAAMLKAWPTADEVAVSQHADVGSLLRYMKKEQPVQHKEMCEDRAVPWGDEPLLPVATCVENLINYLLRTVEAKINKGRPDIARWPDFELSLGEAKIWSKQYKDTGGGSMML